MNHQDEPIPAGEAEAIRKVVGLSLKMLDRGPKPVPRGQHPKAHGMVRAEFVVDPSGLPPECRVGLFAEAKTFPAVVRFSNGAQTDDRKPDVHGMAIKLLGVEGVKLIPEERDATTHDFILIDDPVFFIPDAVVYAPFFEAFAKAKGDVPSTLRSALFLLPKGPRMLAALLSLYYAPRAFKGLGLLTRALSKKPDSPLTSRFWSTTPYRLGPRAVKYSAIPATTEAPPRADSQDLLRLAMKSTLDRGEAVFTFAVQLQADATSTPVEDPTVEWDEKRSKFIPIARLVIPRQEFDTESRRTFCEHLSFTPWHALPEHEPLGGINRTRRAVYQAVSAERHRLNDKPRIEPTLADVEKL
ncbi:catalase family protein [Paludisphaera mucosa]|uniref:Catalase family protein n=1 Tax=Paludisphaera mucosa TaxID=3030827 RepID=A0ABT6FCL3_9BACT|nr:catalase family protein [Paludisphaera mucosa]MDG3005334.1 catalase family protein [Paludisphaera mucosa]